MVDICNEDLYILDPQFEEKDDLDLLTSEEVIADFAGGNGTSVSDETDQGNQPSPLADFADQPLNSSPPVDSCLSSPFNSDLQDLFQLTGNAACPYSTARPSSLLPSSSNNAAGPSSRVHQTLELGPNSLTINTSELGGSKFPNQNGSMGLSQLSPRPYLDSPPRSPRRGQKIPPSYLLQDQLMSAAQSGDVSLLKQLHHKGVNLMKADEKGKPRSEGLILQFAFQCLQAGMLFITRFNRIKKMPFLSCSTLSPPTCLTLLTGRMATRHFTKRSLLGIVTLHRCWSFGALRLMSKTIKGSRRKSWHTP